MAEKASELVQIHSTDHLETLRRCGGYYERLKGNSGKLLGPLVGYTGTYSDANFKAKQWVGDVYANFAMAEQYPPVLFHFARQMEAGLGAVIDLIDVFCGAPLGGYDFATALGFTFDRRVIKAEKKVDILAPVGIIDRTFIAFGRHEPKKGDRVAIVEDVCNNFPTSDKLIELIKQLDAHVVAIVCFLNRSLTVNNTYYSPADSHLALPVVSLVRKPIKEYKQDDLEVAEDIVQGNVVWKPKNEWPRLMAAMKDK